MPRMQQYLSTNGPWSQLVKLNNIALRGLENNQPVKLNQRLTLTPLQVPHRDEYTETVGGYYAKNQTGGLCLARCDVFCQQ